VAWSDASPWIHIAGSQIPTIQRTTMPFQVEAGETVREAILRTRNERLDKVIAALQGKPQPSSEAIHDARRELKRLRSLVQLGRGSMDKLIRTRENQALRNAARALAQSRDASALLETIEGVFGSLTPEDRKSRRVSPEGRQLLKLVCHNLRQHAERGLDPMEIKATVKLLRDMKRRMWLPDAALPEDWYAIAGDGLRRTYRQGRELFAVFNSIGLQNASDELWHETRKRAKGLGYQLRFLRKIWPGALTAIAEQLEELAERLGDDHDLALVRLRLAQAVLPETEFEAFSAARQTLLRTIDRRRRRLQTEALRRSALVYLEPPRRFVKRIRCYWECWQNQQPQLASTTPVQPANSALV
jgi:CHAD domain-containing protein